MSFGSTPSDCHDSVIARSGLALLALARGFLVSGRFGYELVISDCLEFDFLGAGRFRSVLFPSVRSASDFFRLLLLSVEGFPLGR